MPLSLYQGKNDWNRKTGFIIIWEAFGKNQYVVFTNNTSSMGTLRKI